MEKQDNQTFGFEIQVGFAFLLLFSVLASFKRLRLF